MFLWILLAYLAIGLVAALTGPAIPDWRNGMETLEVAVSFAFSLLLWPLQLAFRLLIGIHMAVEWFLGKIFA